ncbi:MAG: repair protein RecO [Clostridiales bacterium]|nr:repair protein RecO [Clostridiales bacterium]
MSLIKTEAIVLKHMDYLEADRILVLFSKELGKIHAIAKGSRRPKSRFLMASEIFVSADYMLYEGKNLYTVTQSEIKCTFFELRQNMNNLAYAAYAANLCDAVIQDEEPNIRAYYLLLKTLQFLSEPDIDASAITLIFAIKLMDFIGYRPLLDQCCNCGKNDIDGPILYFSPISGGVLCEDCAASSDDVTAVNQGFINTVSHILSMRISDMYRLKMSGALKKQLWDVFNRYTLSRIDKHIVPMKL